MDFFLYINLGTIFSENCRCKDGNEYALKKVVETYWLVGEEVKGEMRMLRAKKKELNYIIFVMLSSPSTMKIYFIGQSGRQSGDTTISILSGSHIYIYIYVYNFYIVS